MNKTTGDLYKVYPQDKNIFKVAAKESLWTRIKKFFGLVKNDHS